ncbi:MAG TPA: response regulator transcription factor [Pedobacter sp.]|jgi:DNA-binding NarL/FixJ family response regulator
MINIIIAEDQKLVRNGIKMLLKEDPELNVVGEACNGMDVLNLLSKNVSADLILSDIAMPEMDGINLLGRLRQLYPKIKIVFLSMIDDFDQVATAINEGAHGFLTKDIDRSELFFGIKFAMQGGVYIPGKLTVQLLSNFKSKDCSIDNRRFSARELEVLNLIAGGMTNNEMAEKLFLSKRTIEGHRQELLKKTSTTNTASLIRKAVLSNIIQ